jgi:hypothetical protein
MPEDKSRWPSKEDKIHLTATNGIDEVIAVRESELKRLN